MGQIITDGAVAMLALETLCPSTADPALTAADMQQLLDGARRAYTWKASTSYPMGSVVMPTTRNGRRYKLISFDGSGTSSGTTEPSWPAPNAASANWPVWGTAQPSPIVGWWRNAVVTDGNITWMEDGEDYDSLWDLGRAAFDGWMMKAGRAICAVDLQTGQMRQAQSQIYDHCISMANRYAPAMIG